MTNALVHEAAVTVTESDVVANEAYPLVRELAHAYGLQVIHKGAGAAHNQNSLYLARGDGICVGYAKYDGEDGYVFRNVMVRKERGARTSESYYSYFSSKLPYLMRLIKKEKLIPSSSREILNKDDLMLTGIPHRYAEQFGDTRKQCDINGIQEHQLLEIVFGNRNDVSIPQESIELFKARLDKFRSLDTIQEKRREYLRETLGKSLWVIGYDLSETFMVGKIKVDYQLDDDLYNPTSFKGLDIVQEFKRYRDLHDVPEIMPKMTMLKIHVEQMHRNVDIINGLMPLYSGAIPELDVVGFRNGSNWYEAPLKPNWVVFPCDS